MINGLDKIETLSLRDYDVLVLKIPEYVTISGMEDIRNSFYRLQERNPALKSITLMILTDSMTLSILRKEKINIHRKRRKHARLHTRI